jgi:hypothetical protein
MKTWAVYDNATGFLGYVRAPKKGIALFLAERDLKAVPGRFYIGVAHWV